MEWCCKVFHGWFSEACKRRLGVFVSTQGDAELAFTLQYRALDPGALVPHTDSPLSSVWDAHSLLPLGVVPTCGNGIGTLFANSMGLNCSPDVILLVLGHDLG